MAQQIQLRRDTAANWSSANPVLASGEIGFESDTGKLKIGNGSSAWSALAYFGVASINPASLVGVNATADTTNRLSVASPASLFNHEGAGHQVKVNKNAAANTASFLFQTGFSGRAEIGTTGDDDFHFKVSPDGTAWKEGIKIDKSTGAVTFPSGSGQIQLDAFAASGTWTRPAWARRVTVRAIGGGGGGGSGRKGAASTGRSGGGGGGGGMLAERMFAASELSSTVSVTVGAGGTGGASQTAGSTDGLAGTAGGDSLFGTLLAAKGGQGGGGGPGAGSGAAGGIGYGAPAFSATGSTAPSNGGTTVGLTPLAPARGGGGGCGGGGVTAANTRQSGGDGGAGGAEYGAGATGGAGGPAGPSGTTGGNGASVAAGKAYGGGGGGGGAGQWSSSDAGSGGNGGLYGGGGGGGGGAVDATNNSGAGGNGANGIVVVISES